VGLLPIEVTTDATNIDRVEFYIDGTLVGVAGDDGADTRRRGSVREARLDDAWWQDGTLVAQRQSE
jgi:hypothetical protein